MLVLDLRGHGNSKHVLKDAFKEKYIENGIEQTRISRKGVAIIDKFLDNLTDKDKKFIEKEMIEREYSALASKSCQSPITALPAKDLASAQGKPFSFNRSCMLRFVRSNPRAICTGTKFGPNFKTNSISW